MKRFFPLMLSLCFLFTIAPVAYAADDLSVPEISVSKNARVTSSIGTEYEYISIIDKEAGTAQAVQKNLLTGEYTYGPVVAFSSVGSADALDEAAVTRASPTYHQDTFRILNMIFGYVPTKLSGSYSVLKTMSGNITLGHLR